MRSIAGRASRALGSVAEAADVAVGTTLDGPRRQRAALRRTAHRPFPLPEAPWVLGQTWRRLLFAHWRVPAEQLRARLPAPLELDLLDGEAWLTATAFEICGARLRGTPPPPVLSRFPELNVRTYVTRADRPGIWFFSLDAGSRLAVAAARAAYRLPYFHARMAIDVRDEPWIEYRSERTDRRATHATMYARYRPLGGARQAAPGSLEAWLVERYRLYTAYRGRLLTADIHHAPWTLQDAWADLRVTGITDGLGIDLVDPPLLQYAERQDVLFWPLTRVAGT